MATTSNGRFGLFEVYGVEMEYMIVDRKTLDVRPLADKLFELKTGKILSDVPNGDIEWSNELVNHVVELKTNGPASSLEDLPEKFLKNIQEINQLLERENAMLLPTACHPWMDPHVETKLWEHDHNEIYDLYNRIFDCRGHGWSNLQSTHINLPFKDDEEFARLHSAIRIILPLIPAISASSPILDGMSTGLLDTRLEVYLDNQKRIPSLTGRLIPEQVFSEKEYHDKIFSPIKQDIKPFDTENIMDSLFLNSRGAIARFERGAIEIRVIDIQECPLADICVLAIIVATLKGLTENRWSTFAEQAKWHEEDLRKIFLNTIRHGEATWIDDPNYLKLFGIASQGISASELWKHLLTQVQKDIPSSLQKEVKQLLDLGTLARRILTAVERNRGHFPLINTYKKLAQCLAENRFFNPYE